MKYFGEDSLLHKLIKLGLFLAVVALPLHTTTCNIILITTSALAVIEGIRVRRIEFNIGFLPVAIFVLIIISLLYSQNLKAGLASLELNSSWLFIPLIFGLGGAIVTHELRDKLLITFAGTVLLTCAGAYLFIVFRSGQFLPAAHTEPDFQYHVNPFSRVAFEEVTGIHPSYLSVYLLFTMVIIARLFPLRNGMKAFLIALIFGFILLLSAKNQVVLFFVLLAVVIWNYIQLRRRYKALIIVISTVLMVTLAVANDEIQYRFREEMVHTLGDRVTLWSAGLTIIGQHPVLGVGVGDRQDSVNGEIATKSDAGRLHNFNLHNQYLDFWLMLGLPGLVVFVLILIVPLIYGDFEFKLFTGIMALSLLTESMMYRHRGLVFFLLIYGICGAGYLLKKDSRKKDQRLPSIP